MGHFGKGLLNSNGEALLEFCKLFDFYLSNTHFQHKLCHVTTWESPERKNCRGPDGNPRRNPFRNQIDYILVPRSLIGQVQNSRAYSGIHTFTNHRMVILTIKLYIKPEYKSSKKSPPIDYAKLKEDTKIRADYKQRITEEMAKTETPENIQDRWDKIIRIEKDIASEVIGPKPKKRQRVEDPEIVSLSEHQRKLQNDINCSTDKDKRAQLKVERNQTMNKIHYLKHSAELKELDDDMSEIEKTADDSAKMFAAVRALQNRKPKEPLLLDKPDGGKTSNDEDHAEIITNYFRSLFQTSTAEELSNVPPMPMRKKFTPQEVTKAIGKLKNSKAAGIDELKAEQLKYGPEIIACEISDILNECASTGKHPREIKLGVLSALQKPGKPLGPCKSLRPIVLLSMLRKILAIIFISRVGDKIRSRIPLSQAAYTAGRSTTEHVLAFKLLAEKAITSEDYEVHLLLKDMSRDFHTVNRKLLMEDLRAILDPDELHIAKLLLEDVSLIVRCGSSYGEEFKTNIGTPQGDCASPILFTLYLANALQDQPKPEHDHTYSVQHKPKEEDPEDHTYSRTCHRNTTKEEDVTTSDIDAQYADDISYAAQNYHHIQTHKKDIPPKLEKRDLISNASKDEEFKVCRKYNPEECVNCSPCGRCLKCKKCKECIYCKSWKSCKLLGSMLETEADMKRRKVLSLEAMRNMEHHWRNSRNSIKTKMRIFNAYITPIALYNSHLWSMNTTREGTIDAFQRRLLRHAINIRYPRRISNESLYNITKEVRWSQAIAYRRLVWFGHMMRLPAETPVRRALKEAEIPVKLPRGRPKTTWLSSMKNQLAEAGMSWENAKVTAEDRESWREVTRGNRPLWAEVPV